MGFTGNLQTLPISEVLSLLISSAKTGVLNCSGDDDFIQFFFYNSKLIKLVTLDERLLFGEIMIKRGLINRQDLSYALKLQKDVGKLLGEVFIDLNMLNAQHILDSLKYQLEEVLFRIVEWGGGRFSFEEQSVREASRPMYFPFNEINLPIFLKQFNDKAIEFKKLAEQLPSDNSKLSLFVTMDQLDTDIIENREIMEIIQLSDGTRTLQEIRRACSFGVLKAQRLIFTLYLKDIIKVVSSGGMIKPKKIYESLQQEVEGVKELFQKIFPPAFDDIHKAFADKMGPKSEKILSEVTSSVSDKFSELFKNIEIERWQDLKLDDVFKNINVHQDMFWYHTILSMLNDVLNKMLNAMSGTLGRTQVEKVVDTIRQRVDLHLEENKVLSNKYNLKQEFERLFASFKIKK
jgi:hypothetical protein